MDIKLKQELDSTIKGIVILNIIILVLLMLTSNLNQPMVLGLVFGSIIAILNFRLLVITVEKVVTMTKGQAQLYSSSRYIIRMGIVAMVLLVSARASHINIIGVAIGLVSPKFVILSKYLLIDKLKRKEA